MESGTLIKSALFIAVIGGGFYYYNASQKAHELKVEAIAASISDAARIIEESGGSQPDQIVAALSFVETTEWGLLEEGLLKTGGGQSNFAAAELVLRRIYEVPPGTMLPTALTQINSDPTWPWVLSGGPPAMEPFELKNYAAVGGIDGMLEEFRQKGSRRAAWQ